MTVVFIDSFRPFARTSDVQSIGPAREGKLLHDTPDYQLSVDLRRVELGAEILYEFKLLSYVPHAKRLENRVQCRAVLTRDGLWRLNDEVRREVDRTFR